MLNSQRNNIVQSSNDVPLELPVPNTTCTELLDALKPVKRRLRLQRAVRGLGWALMICALLEAAVMAMSFVFPLEHKWMIIAALGCGVPLVTAACLLWPINAMTAARAADNGGLEERVQTALLLSRNEMNGLVGDGSAWLLKGGADKSGEDNEPDSLSRKRESSRKNRRARNTDIVSYDFAPIVNRQRADAIDKLSSLNAKAAVPVYVKRIHYCIAAVALAIIAALVFVPNPQDSILAERERLAAQLSSEAEKLDKYAETLPFGIDESEPEQDPTVNLRKITTELAKRLRESTDKRDALLALSDANAKLERLKSDTASRQNQETADALNNAGLSPLGNALKSGEQSALEQAASTLSDEISSVEDESELADKLAEAAKELDDSNPAKSALSNAAQAVANGANADSANGGNMSADSALRAMAAQLGASGASSGSNGNVANASASALGNIMSGIRANLASGTANSGSASSGTGKGSGSGSGSGSGGKGTGSGSGAGAGSTNKDMGISSGGADGESPNGAIRYKLGEYEQIYDPTRLGNGGEVSNVTGQVNEGDTAEIQLTPGDGDYSGSVPYNEVAGEYRESAYKSMQEADLPSGVRQLVDDYFNALID